MTAPLGKPVVHVLADGAALADAALARVAAKARESVAARGRFTLALAGGSTPRALYQQLAQHPELPWSATELCFGDERPVGPDHPDSNARMVREALTHQPFIPPERVHRMRGELPAAEAAADYEQTLRRLFPEAVDFPSFDLVLLGLGSDGHTASLFPRSPALSERRAWVTESWVDALSSARITLTYPVLNAAREVLFLVAGKDKAPALAAVLEGDQPLEELPARGIQPQRGTLRFLVDSAAASGLSGERSGEV